MARNNPEIDKRGAELQVRLIDFAVRIIAVANAVPNTPVGRHIALQIIRCGTSPAANYAEAIGSESRADFIHKMGIALKELRETHVWLQIILNAQLIKPTHRLDCVLNECHQLISIFVTSINTAREHAITH